MAANPKTEPRRPRPTAAALPIEADELHEAEVAAYVARNRDALEESIARAEAELSQGVQSTRTIGDIIRDGRRRHRNAR